ncbi:sensor histidine kinase [Streptomyces sp. ID05-47C]|uniref:sensor histidine kinase n=1 Tax=Streptomyces sp. ID05-47C TaxID=3028665 RepID=UPI0029ADA468|nr:sensor histidine kinase [Streptomyces sp. ID05-47C]MDX3570059.1 sensor histidine kinase [Streptomyces sp. ID05-47C]
MAARKGGAVRELRTRQAWADACLAAGSAAVAVVLALSVEDGRRPDLLGWTLLLAAQLPLLARRRHPLLVMLAVVACVGPYHALDYTHSAAVPVGMIALYSVAVSGSARRTLHTGVAVLSVPLAVNAFVNPHQAAEVLRISGWIVSVLLFGGYLRIHRQNAAAALERAERAERTREEEARRRVAEERLRIARDLHDLLAHSITLIGVQTSVAAHVLTADPDRLDRTAVAKALDDIAETCRSARGELRTTLEVLRDPGGPEARGPLPGLHGLSDLADTARAAGARVDLSVRGEDVPPAVGAAVYRIVQEALTNAVRHGGRDDLNVRVAVHDDAGALRVTVSDDGSGTGAGVPGFGLVGMRERARSIGGVLEAGPREGKGFEVSAVLPLGQPATRGQSTGEQQMGEHR